MKRWVRLMMGLALLGGLLGLLAACDAIGAAGASATATPLYPLLPTSTVALANPPTVAPPATPTQTQTAYSPPCLASALRMSVLPDGGVAMGHAAVIFQFTNAGTAQCSLRGFPNARLLDSAGNALAVKVVQTTQAYLWPDIPLNTIELAPNGSAYFEAQVDTAQSGAPCVYAAKTLISPPQSAMSFAGFVSSRALSSCDGYIYLSPVVAQRSDL
ncbi:MAG TPA: DUF4232 domain-containing protein [Ktedonobacterales bacterium]